MLIRNKTLKMSLYIVLIFQIWANLAIAEEKIVSSVMVDFKRGELILHSQRTPLGMILDEIRRKCMVEILGLENRANELLTFSSQGGTLPEELKRLLSSLGERNYAFEFVDEKLRRVSVLPKAKSDFTSFPVRLNQEVIGGDFVKVPKIQSLVDGSQAQTLDLLEGDLIVEYDGVQIRTADQLIKETKKKSQKEQVEMIIVREKIPIRFVLNAGFIGVRIKTITIPKEDLAYYYSGLLW